MERRRVRPALTRQLTGNPQRRAGHSAGRSVTGCGGARSARPSPRHGEGRNASGTAPGHTPAAECRHGAEAGRLLTAERRARQDRRWRAATVGRRSFRYPIRRSGDHDDDRPSRSALLALLGSLSLASIGAGAVEPAECRPVRFADIGWTDITATTSLATVVLQGLGYKPSTTIASVPIAFTGLKKKSIDVFLAIGTRA